MPIIPQGVLKFGNFRNRGLVIVHALNNDING